MRCATDPQKDQRKNADQPGQCKIGGNATGDHQKPSSGGNHILIKIHAGQSVMIWEVSGKHFKMHQKATDQN